MSVIVPNRIPEQKRAVLAEEASDEIALIVDGGRGETLILRGGFFPNIQIVDYASIAGFTLHESGLVALRDALTALIERREGDEA